MRINSIQVIAIFVFILIYDIFCYEKTLRKIVRNQSKMVQRPFSDTIYGRNNYSKSSHLKDFLMFPGFTQVKGVIHKKQRPKVSTILSSVETGRTKPMYSKMKLGKNDYQNELRLTRDTFYNVSDPSLRKSNVLFPDYGSPNVTNMSNSGEVLLEEIGNIPNLSFIPPTNNIDKKINPNDLLPEHHSTFAQNVDNFQFVKYVGVNKYDTNDSRAVTEYDIDRERADFFIEEPDNRIPSNLGQDKSVLTYTCINLIQRKTDIDAQDFFLDFDIEPPWVVTKRYWNKIYDNRYEFLMRNPNWPSLKVILVPRTHVDTIWKKPFHIYHKETVQKIITNMIKKLQFYPNLTFTWNEVSHLSQWWKFASQKRRVSLRRLIREGRLEITTGGWVETDEATSSLFGILHQFMEGRQWLHRFLKYKPKVAWLTKSVTHSPTFPYILSASGISNLVFTNVHLAWEQFFAEYQYSDFMWIQSWDQDKITNNNNNNQVLNKIGKDRYPKHTVLTHYLQFNSDGFEACGPESYICSTDFNFANKILDINTYNVKIKSETLLEQYSKTGTTSPHNIVIAPIGDPFHYDTQTEFDYQYNNYLRISDFINTNQNIYKATIHFGTPADYFTAITDRHKSFYPTLKGDFLNFADIHNSNVAYWSGFFTTRPILKILLRRLQATLRSTEILFTFTLSFNALRGNVSEMFIKLLNAREIVARLQDRNVISGTLPASMVRYVQNQILAATKDCWYIQEAAVSLLTSKLENNEKYIFKYIYRDGEFISPFKSAAPGDHLYVFNSYSHERSEIIELITRNPNIRVVDHNKKDVAIQINPFWKYNSEKNFIQISRQFFKIIFVINVAPMTIELFKIKETYDAMLSVSTVFCMMCTEDSVTGSSPYQFNIQPIETGDIQIENYKFRLIFDEVTGFLKNVIEKENIHEKQILLNYGAFKSSDTNSGIFLFNTNTTSPLHNVFKRSKNSTNSKIVLIISGNVATYFFSIYGRLLQHTVQIYNIINSPLSNVIRVESKIDFEASPKHRELEMFMSVQTDIGNGNNPEIFIDNNGFQYTSRVLNLSRRVESNMFAMTSMAYIQDEKNRLTIITDHAQGVTALQEGQIIVMLDRRVLFNDGRGVDEGLADSSSTNHVHYILLENLVKFDDSNDKLLPKQIISMPSILAIHMANTLNYPLDMFFIDRSLFLLCHYAFLPLIQSSFPCDIVVINFRVLATRLLTDTVNAALVTLHRQSYSCQTSYNDIFHCMPDVNFNIEKILQHVKEVLQTNLFGTSEGIPIKNVDLVNFPAMELITLKIIFR